MHRTIFFKWLVFISLAAILVPPLYAFFYLQPAFTRYITKITELEAVRVAEHLSSIYIPKSSKNEIVNRISLLTGNDEWVRKQFNLKKIKFFLPSGEVIMSTDPEEVGHVNDRYYFKTMVAKGQTYTKLVRKDTRSLEDQIVTSDVVETYVPIVRDGKFIGAFEIYFDITDRNEQLGTLTERFYYTLLPMALLLLSVLLYSSYRTSRYISEQIQAEKETAKVSRQMERILSAVGEGIYGVDKDGITTFVNPAAARMLGYERDELIGKAHHEMLHPGTSQGVRHSEKNCPISAVFKDGKPHKGTDQIFWRKDGSKFLAEFSCVPIIEDGVITGAVSTFADITERKQAEEKLQVSLINLRRGLAGTIQAMAMIVETRDPYTAGHQRRTTDLARAIAQELGLADEMVDGIRMAGVIHDLGKISVPAEILSKPGSINDLEYNLIKVHAEAGYDILKGIDFPWPIAQIVMQHHERLDGSGYPRGLCGDEIILEARVMAVADVVEAMASHRPYRPAHSVEEALEEIISKKGTCFDPDVVDACVRLFKEKGFSFDS
jgi:PAS domain S-box-containing protein